MDRKWYVTEYYSPPLFKRLHLLLCYTHTQANHMHNRSAIWKKNTNIQKKLLLYAHPSITRIDRAPGKARQWQPICGSQTAHGIKAGAVISQHALECKLNLIRPDAVADAGLRLCETRTILELLGLQRACFKASNREALSSRADWAYCLNSTAGKRTTKLPAVQHSSRQKHGFSPNLGHESGWKERERRLERKEMIMKTRQKQDGERQSSVWQSHSGYTAN